MLISFYRNALIMKLNNLPSFRAIRALIASRSTFEQLYATLSYCYLYLILHTNSGVFWHVMFLEFGCYRWNIYLRQWSVQVCGWKYLINKQNYEYGNCPLIFEACVEAICRNGIKNNRVTSAQISLFCRQGKGRFKKVQH